MTDIIWTRPSSCDTSACVEVAVHRASVHVRNSNQPAAVAMFSFAEWRAHLAAAKAGEYDLPEVVMSEG